MDDVEFMASVVSEMSDEELEAFCDAIQDEVEGEGEKD